MKKLVFTLAMCLMVWMVQATVSRTVTNIAGSLETNLGADLPTVTDLTVTGTMDARDFKTIRDNMPALENVDLSNSSILEWNGTGGTSLTVSIKYNANQIPTRAFYNKIFTTLLLPTLSSSSSITIGIQAFYGYNSPNMLLIPDMIKIVGSGLNYCAASFMVAPSHTAYSSIDGVLYNKSQTSITQVPTSKTGDFTVPTTVSSIGGNAFAGCTSITSVQLPATLTGITPNAFIGCTGLTSITIPQTVTSIGGGAFSGCTGLNLIKVLNPTPITISGSVSPFIGVSTSTCILQVPSGKYSAYKEATFWQDFTNIQDASVDLVTNAANNITATAATLNGNITALGQSPVTAYGFCWNTTGTPTISDNKTDKGSVSSNGTFSSDLTLLQANTKYYVRSYAISNGIITYGIEVNFTTLNTYQITTNAATNVLVKSATLNGSITYNEPTAISNYGFCWNTTSSPTIADSKEDLGVNPTAGAFSKNITSLNGSTTYYYRTFATSGGVTTYGSQQSFTTSLPDDYDITVQINGNGTVSSGTAISNGALVNVLRGATKTFTITPNAGYQITAITYNGVDVYSQVTNNQYTTPAVNSLSTLSVSFGNNTKTINVATAGTLSTLLSAIDKSIITNLTVSGNIDATDFVTMRDAMPLLTVLDLSGATIMAYNGNAGTNQWTSTYPANEMPEYSFWKYLDYSYFSSIKSIKLPINLSTLSYSVFRQCKNLKTIICLATTPPTNISSSTFEGCVLNAVYVSVGKVAAYKAASGWSAFNIVEPGIITTTPTINGLIYAPNSGPSEIKPFKVSGGLLTNNITITAPANFEISAKTGTAFTPTDVITISPIDGMVADTTIYVRLKSGLSINTYNENITIASTGFTTLNIALNGAVRNTPESIHVTTAGTLSSLLTATEKAAIKKLTVTGDIDARDFKCMRDEMTLLAILDLSNVNILTFDGTGGTYYYLGNTQYPANTIPQQSFFYYNTQTGKTTLNTIKFPTTITSIGSEAFSRCSGLKGNLTIPNSVTGIDIWAFFECSNLKNIIIGKSVTNIGQEAFKQWSSIGVQNIICLNPTPPTLGIPSPFSGQNPTIVYVPIGSVPSYKAADGWSTFNIVEPGITTSTPTINGLIYAPNAGPSEIQSFKVSGGLLTSDITVTVPTNYELSTKTGAEFTPTNVIAISPIDGMVADTTLYVRLKAGLSLNTYNDNITVASTGFTTLNIALNGAVRTTPEIINVATAGTLSSLLATSEKAAISRLKITGFIDASDFMVLNDNMPNLAILDISEVTIKSYPTPDWAATKYYDNEIPMYAFCGNYGSSPKYSLKSIKLPNNLSSISISAFQNCSNLKTIISLNTTPPTLLNNCFTGVTPTVVYVPIGKVAAYKAVSGWNNFDQYNTSLITNISEPGITTSTPTINGLIYAPNAGPSEIKPFKVSGGLLTSNVTINAPANYEISTKSGAEFTPTNVITISPIDGMVADTTLYVRLKAGLSLNSYAENINLETIGFTTQSIALNGIVRNTPETIHVTTVGTLSSLLTATEKASVTKLRVTGNIDARDVKCMRDEMTLLANLNLKDANIMAYNGNGGTYQWTNSYPANEMPQYSFKDASNWNSVVNLKRIQLPTSISSIGSSAFESCYNLGIIIILNPTPPTTGGMTFGNISPTFYVAIGSLATYKNAWSSFNILEYKLKPTTKSVSSIKLNSAKISGSLDVITDSPVTAHGFCWNTTGTPTIANSKVDNGATSTEGTYSNTIDNLAGATTYYVRAFATDGASGTVYGDEISFTTAEIPATSNLGGNYFNSQYWSKSKSPYTITDNVSLAEGTTLTIEPGVVVNFAGNYEIITLGSVIANGTANDSITFNANGNTCTFLDFKNTKLSDTELSYLKMIGYKNVPTLYAKALKTQGTCTDSLTLNNSRIETSEINCQKTVTINNSKIANFSAAASSLVLDNSTINNAFFGDSWTYGTVNIVVKNSTATGLNFNGDSYNSRNTILNSTVKSSNFGRSSTNVEKSRLYKCNFSANSWENPTIKLDSTILSYTSFSVGSGWSTVTNCIFINDSTQTVNLNGVTTKSQFIGDNKLDGVGIDAASGTITNSLISTSKIGALAGSLTINNSNFMNNSQYNIKNTGANTIDAKSNFWGVGNTTIAAVKSMIYDYYKDLTLGKVLYDNYLSIPNIDCPVMSPQNVQKTAVTEGVNYTWNANPESDIKGYKLYYGAFDGFTFANSVDVGNVTTYTLSNTSLTDIVLVTAYDQQADGKDDMIEGYESWYSAYVFPEKAGVISGSTTVCQAEKSKVYTVPAIDNATTYIWTLPEGATGASVTNSIVVDFGSSAISGEITVKGQNDFGVGAVSTLAIAVNSVPTTTSGLGTIMGMSTVNQGQNSVTYNAYYTNATSYKWTLPDGAIGTSTTNSISVNYSTSAVSGNITVIPLNDCGEGIPTSLAITVRPLPDAAGLITGSASVCYGQSAVIYTVEPISNATSYQWTLPAGTYGYSTTNSISVNYNSAGSGNISVYGRNSVGSGVASTLPITVIQPVGVAGAISGPTTVCLGDKSVTYTTPLIENATSYSWTLPSGVTGESTSNSISVDYGASSVSGNITVKGKNSCGEGWFGSTISIVVVQPIGNAGTISGATTVCQGENNVVYTVPAIDNATSYEWTLPTGATGTSTTNSITVNYAKSAISGNISVKGINSCGNGLSSTLSVAVNPLPVAAGTITGKTTVCQGESSITYTVPAIQNATSYTWTLPSGASGSSTTNIIDVDFSNSAISGNISVKGHNDCGDGIVSTLPITINQLPVISVTDKTVICGGSVLLDATTNYYGGGTLEYSWSPSTGLNDATIANPTATLVADKTYTLTVKTPSGCTTSRNVTVKIIPMPKPNICMVGVHSSNKNIVVWEKPVSTGIDSYNIYRETNVTNVFDKIGSIPYNSTSVFIDNSSSPDVQSNSYKLTIVDKLGYESEQSNLHKTMHLSINKGLNATWNLNWEKYEGFTVSTYNVYRGTTVDNLALIGSTSGSSSQYSDVNAPTGDVYYQLEVVNPNPCTVSASLNTSKKVKNLESSVLELYSSSRSNIATNVLSGINNNYASGSIKIYPNPVHNELRLEYDGNARFEILNLVGQVLYNGILVKTALVETSHLFPGIYLIRFTQGNTIYTEKFIKE